MELQKSYLWDTSNPLGYGNQMGNYKTTKVVEFVKRHIITHTNKILDMGGGSGRIALPLLKEGYTNLSLVDLDRDAIQLCHQRGISNAYCSIIEKFDQTGFDTVLAIELFIVTSPQDVIQQANKKLREGGTFIFTGTNKLSWRYWLHKKRKKTTKNLGEYTLSEYRQLIVKNGFSILRIEGYNWMPFKVNSNTVLIRFFAGIENLFFLRYWLKQSPYLLFACKKDKTI
jgi:2-polyprenyl-3-methyl-5-hydroxy-6-metoxy-1,4-benzoquinol methylase